MLHYLRAAGGLLPVILNDGGAQDQRIDGGSQIISERLAADLGDRVLLGRPALRIEDHAPDRMRVVTPVETFTADRVIVAMAPADTARIEFAPGLAEAASRAGVWLGAPAALAARQSRRCCTRDRSGAPTVSTVRCRATAGPIQLVFDNSPEDASMGVLSCFLSVVECPQSRGSQRRASRA